jgi:NAD-dependent deacetylase
MKEKQIVIFSGAGMSAESGIATFRGSDGLWNGHRIEDVATPEAFQRNPEMVLEFYNLRRDNVREAQPNRGHQLIAELETGHEVQVITQNIDDLHERAGSSRVLHLHGEIMKGRGSRSSKTIVDLGSNNISMGDKAPDGTQLRPHVVWFGEAVPAMEEAISLVSDIDYFVVVGTSLVVYPAASLLQFTSTREVVCIDPTIPELAGQLKAKCYPLTASEGIARWIEDERLM